MTSVTFQVLEGIDKGRIFQDLPIPVTIGREEGNLLRLNDERVSRFHAKVQQDNGDIILTDLDSTNGTRVNGNVVQIRRLRPGDRVCIGRSILLFGSNTEIAARIATIRGGSTEAACGSSPEVGPSPSQTSMTVQSQTIQHCDPEQEVDEALNAPNEMTMADEGIFIGKVELPPLPQKLTPAQAARFAEILDFLHRGLSRATDDVKANEEGSQVVLNYTDWQKVLAVQLLLARYLRAVSEPESQSD